MRTTLTLEPDVEKRLREEAHRQRRSFKDVVNDTLRRGLTMAGRTESRGRFRVRPHRTTLLPGIDPGAMNRLVDDLEDEAVTQRMHGGQ